MELLLITNAPKLLKDSTNEIDKMREMMGESLKKCIIESLNRNYFD